MAASTADPGALTGDPHGGCEPWAAAAAEQPPRRAAALEVAVDEQDAETIYLNLEELRAQGGDEAVLAVASSSDSDGNTLLHRCAAGPPPAPGGASAADIRGAVVAELLVTARADVNGANLLGETPLLVAARSLSSPPLDVVRVLLSSLADPARADALSGDTALMEAACRGNDELCKILLEARADPLQANLNAETAADFALGLGHCSVADLLGFAPTAPSESTQSHAHSQTQATAEHAECELGSGVDGAALPLWAATQASDLPALSAVLAQLSPGEAEAELAAEDAGGRTLLHACAGAAGCDDAADMARLLLEARARVEARDALGRTPMSVLLERHVREAMDPWGVQDLLRVLLVAGASPDAVDEGLLADVLLQPDGPDVEKLLQAFRTTRAANATEEEARAEEAVTMPVKELREHCREQGIPTEGCVEKESLLARLFQARAWRALPMSELQQECEDRGVPFAAFAAFATRADMEAALMAAVWADQSAEQCQEQYEAKGVPAGRLASLQKADWLLREFERVETSSAKELQKECRQRGLELEAGLEKQEIILRLKNVLIWDALALKELKREFQKRNLAPSGERADLVKQLIAADYGAGAARNSRYGNIFEQGRRFQEEEEKSSKARKGEKSGAATDSGYSVPGGGAQAFRANLFRQGVRQAQSAQGRPPMGPPPRRPPQGEGRPDPEQDRAKATSAAPQIEHFFAALGLQPHADQNEVRKAYRKLALQYHPDKNPGALKEEAAAKFRKVNEAYNKVRKHLQEQGQQKCQGGRRS